MPESTSTASLFDRIGGRSGLDQLLRHFYADVRQHREIGPIFLRQIDDWPAHLALIGDFWMGATGGPVTYQGPMPAKHLPLGLEEKHFQAWLDLWQRQCRTRLPAREAAEMIARAEAIAVRLRELVGLGGEGRRDSRPPG